MMLAPGRCAAASHSHVRDGGFEQSAPGAISPSWAAHGSWQVARDIRHTGRQSLRVGPDSLVEQSTLALAPGSWCACSGWLRARDVRPTGPGHAYLAIYQYDDTDSLLAYNDFAQVTGTCQWTRYTWVFQVSPGAARVSFRAGIWQAGGEAWVDDLTLVEGRDPAEWAPGMDEAASALNRAERVAILRDDLPAAGAPSSPDHLASLLRAAGVETRFVTAQELADSGVFNRDAYDLVVLPYGPTFPLAAYRAFQQFLGAGGDFISMGGYAFDNLVAHTPEGWLPQAQALKRQQEYVPIGGDFEGAPWAADLPETCAAVTETAHSGAHSLRVQVPPGATPLGGRCHRDVPGQAGQEFIFSGWIKAGALGREADGFAFLAVYQYDGNGKLRAFRDIAHVTAPQDWQRCEWRFRVAPGVTTLRLIAGLYNTSGTAWFDDLELARAPHVVVMNTRSGVPADGLQVSPLQVGVFDPSYPLERAACARGSGEGFIFPANIKLRGPFEGWAASGVIGWNQARWVSLVDACDRYGRRRGSVGALLRNYAGVYARSSWAFFGVTNCDLFAPGHEEMEQGFVRLAQSMLVETYLRNLETDRACYRQGELVKIMVRVSNFGRRARAAEVRFDAEALGMGAGEPKARRRRAVAPGAVSRRVVPGETAEIEVEWRPQRFDGKFYRVGATLVLDGQPADRMETGFAVADDRAVAAGPAINFADNYIEADGVRHFLLGSDTYGNMFSSAAHNPLTWARDLGMMRDNGITVYENLQVSPAAFPEPYVPDERFARQALAMVQLAQQMRLIYVPGLLIGYNTAVSDGLLKQQAGWCESYARMFAQAPGIIYYANGDLRLEIQDTPEMRALYAAFLKQQYATPEALQEAWRAEPPITAFEQVSVTAAASRGWDDLRVRDRHLFEWWLVRRWLTAMHDGSKAGDPDRPTTVEFYGQPYGGIDIRAALGPIIIGNMGYFGLKGSDVAEFPALFKFSDMRAYGQSLSIGEFGCKTHPAWAETRDYHQTRTEDEQIDLYLALPHYALGLGACKVHNWCWADAEESIFPWGLVHANDRAPKRVLSAYRNVALLFKHLQPQYREPQVWVVVPTSHRAGANSDQVYRAILTCITALTAARADFGVIDEDRLAGSLPREARVLFWPLPYCPSDQAFSAVEGFVRRGGYAYISGDFSFDPDRKRTRVGRLERLAGVRFKAQNFVGLSVPEGDGPEAVITAAAWSELEPWRCWPAIAVEAASAEVIARGTGGEPRLVLNRVGQGAVLYTPDILEAAPNGRAATWCVYRAFLGFARVPRLPVEPEIPGIHAFGIPTRDGGTAYVLFNGDATCGRRITLSTEHHEYALTLGPQKPGFVLEDTAGRTLAVEAGGPVLRDGKGLARADTHFMLVAEDGRDLAESQELLLMPLGTGRVRVERRLAGGATAPRLRSPRTAASPLSAQVGEVVGGRWTPFETIEAQRSGAGFELEVDADRAVSLMIVGPREDLARLGDRVARILTEP
jgi:hypothetical protein